MEYEEEYDPCEGCEYPCDGWEALFCCAKCMADGVEDCENCDPWDI